MAETLMQVRRESKLTSRQLANAAGVPLHVEYLAEIGGLVGKVEAESLLGALSHLTGKEYTLQNVQIAVREDLSQLDQQPSLPKLRLPGKLGLH
jgi:hypothetical protein